MFIDGVTGKVSKPKQKAEKLVTKTRPKSYYNKNGDKISEGWEIVEEVLVTRETMELVKTGKVKI